MVKKVVVRALLLIVGLLLGLLIALMSEIFGVKYLEYGVVGIVKYMLTIYILVIMAIVCQMILHEIGHYIGGLLTGYKLISIRVGSHVWYRNRGKLKRGNYSMPGLLGECLMKPPKMKDGKFAYKLYIFGGVIINLLTVVVSIVVLIKLTQISDFWRLFFILFCIAGFLYALLNGMPSIATGMPNDAHNEIFMRKKYDNYVAFYYQLKIMGMLYDGSYYSELKQSWFDLFQSSDAANPLITKMKTMEYYKCLDTNDFEEADSLMYLLEKNIHRFMPIIRLEIEKELLFMELIGPCRTAKVKQYLNPDVRRHLENEKYILSNYRILYAYEICYKKNYKKSEKIYRDFQQVMHNYPIEGDVEVEWKIMEFLNTHKA